MSHSLQIIILTFLILEIRSINIYIYEWPDDIIWVPPTKHDGRRGFDANGGLGMLLDEKLGIYETAPYSLYQYMLSRLIISPNRVYDPSIADIFFIPLDLTHNTWESSKITTPFKNFTLIG